MYLAMIGRLTAFYLKYFDYLLKRAPVAYDSACGLYFMGRKSKTALNDRRSCSPSCRALLVCSIDN